MKHALLVDGTDLVAWADRRDAQGDLPRLVRRLVQATSDRLSRIGFPAGEGVALGGWDGIVEAETGNAFVPDGKSVWEMGVNQKKKAKADGDYEKRTKDPGDVDLAETTFVFITPRRWSGKDDWANDRKAEDKWKDVRAYDADDLETWLDIAPATHAWISIHLGKYPEGAIDLENHWADWSETTRPALTPELVLAGRASVVDHIRTWLRNDADPLAIQGESRQEAIAVLAASLHGLPDDERTHHLSRALVVSDSGTWNRVVSSAHPLILIRDFDSPDGIPRASRQGHKVVIPLERADTPSPGAVEIPRLPTEEATAALLAMGKERHEAEELAALARRGFTSFRRKLAVSPEVQQPPWAKPQEALPLCPAVLAGTWDDASDGDRAAIAALAGTTYESVTSNLMRWWNASDAPMRQVADKWIVTSKEDAWSLLARYLTRDSLARFQDVAIDVLSSADPRYELAKDERWTARVHGEEARHSGMLRHGLADTLAVMGARDTPVGSGDSARDRARVIVRRILEAANADWRVWASLSSLLSLFAEAAPDEFLQAAEKGVEGSDATLIRLLGEEEDAMFGTSPHTGLLWALETLAWSPEYLSRVSLLLAKLARQDPGGKLANRPHQSLRDIFLAWYPLTAATLPQRLAVLDTLRAREPDVAWRLLQSLLPEDHSVGGHNPRPRWREWAPESSRRAVPKDLVRSVNEVVTRMMADAGDDGARWSDLVGALGELPLDDHDRLVEHLGTLDLDRMSASTSAIIWNALRAMVSKHRSFSDADWALPRDRVEALAGLLGRLEPKEHGPRFGWLFSHHPELPNGRESDFEAYDEEVARARFQAVDFVHSESGVKGLIEFADQAPLPFSVGETVGQNDLFKEREDAFLEQHLEVSEQTSAQLALGFVVGRMRAEGRGWVESKLQVREWAPGRQAAFLSCLEADGETFDIVERLGPEVEQLYWSNLGPFGIWESHDVSRAGRKLMEFARPAACVALLGSSAIRKKNPEPALIADALEAALQTAEEWTPDSHEIGKLLDALETSDIEEGRVALLEWAYLAVLRHSRPPRVLLRELSRNAQFFAQAVELVFRAEEEEPRDMTKADKACARRGHDLLESWRNVPGTDDAGLLDASSLKAWMHSARDALKASGRLSIGDYMIGKAISGSPLGDDGGWPHEAVRDEIEAAESSDLERGIHIGKSNSRGPMNRSPKRGGEPERKLAEEYAKFAGIARDRWPRTAAMLDRMADSYRSEARHEDQQSELREDLG